MKDLLFLNVSFDPGLTQCYVPNYQLQSNATVVRVRPDSSGTAARTPNSAPTGSVLGLSRAFSKFKHFQLSCICWQKKIEFNCIESRNLQKYFAVCLDFVSCFMRAMNAQNIGHLVQREVPVRRYLSSLPQRVGFMRSSLYCWALFYDRLVTPCLPDF